MWESMPYALKLAFKIGSIMIVMSFWCKRKTNIRLENLEKYENKTNV